MEIFREIYLDQKKHTRELIKAEYGEDINDGPLSDKLIDELTLKYGYYCIKELTEVVDETNFKPHVLSRKALNNDKIKEELIDSFKYWLNLCILHGFYPEEIVEEYWRKSKIVRERYQKELDNG
jgi:NTP pyrophosphatase (non-canonical NTP hydrolase)